MLAPVMKMACSIYQFALQVVNGPG
jgi:hypothetical protein